MQKKWQKLVLALGFLFSAPGALAAESVYQADIQTLEAQLFPEAAQNPAFTTIALPLEGFVVQAIPQRNAKLFAADDVIKADQSKGRDLYFVINPHVQKLLKYLDDNKYEVKVYTALGDEVVKQLLAGVKFGGKQSLDKLATSVTVDVSKALSDSQFGKNVLFVTYGDIKAPAAQTIATGPIYYVFPSFAKMTENKVADPAHAPYFTDKESAWAIERNKAARVFTYLFEANRIDAKNFATIKADLSKESQADVIRRGRERLAGTYSRLRYRWGIADAKAKVVTGCEIADTVKNLNIKDADLAACEDMLGVFLEFKIDKKTVRVQSCEIRTRDRRNLIRQAGSLDECIKDDSDQIRYAVEFNSKQCAAFTKDGNFISFGTKKDCEKQFVVLVPQKNKYYFFKPFKGVEKLTQAQLFRTVLTPPPTAQDPFRLYDPIEDNFHGGVPLMSCYDSSVKQTMNEDAKGQLVKGCQPDTLYSWGTWEKVLALKKVMGDRGSWQKGRSFYASRGPITTFGYGDIPVRIKLKSGVKFKRGGLSIDCGNVNAEESKTTVYYRKDGHWSDWAFCDSNVVHSWSYGTKEHYDEMVKEFWRYKEVHAKSLAQIGIIEFYSPKFQEDDIFFNATLDGRSVYSQARFTAVMGGLVKRIEAGEEGIIYNPSVPSYERQRSVHFETRRPTFWNDQ